MYNNKLTIPGTEALTPGFFDQVAVCSASELELPDQVFNVLLIRRDTATCCLPSGPREQMVALE